MTFRLSVFYYTGVLGTYSIYQLFKEVPAMSHTISSHLNKGPARQYNRNHNIRLPEAISDKDHIDPNGIHENWVDETARDAYQRLFGESARRYNARQKRKDRRYRSYMAELKRTGRGQRLVHEMVVQIGNIDNAPDAGTGYQILREYIDGWPERNPNLALIGAYYHADEKTPHVHVDFIPVAHGYIRGQDTQAGFVKALKEQGVPASRGESHKTHWINSENLALEMICRRHGLEIEHPHRENARHLDTDVYKKQKAAESAERAAKQAQDDMMLSVDRYNQVMHDISVLQEKYDGLHGEVEALESQKEATLREIAELERRRGELLEMQEKLKKYERLRAHCSMFTIGDRTVLQMFDDKENPIRMDIIDRDRS